MSTKLRRAIERIRADESGACWFAGERPESLIETAEQTLGFRFPPSFRLFARELGAGSVGSEEIYGVTSPNFDNGSIPNGVWLTLRARTEWNLPDSLLVIYFDGGVDYYVLECGAGDQPGITRWRPGITTSNTPRELVEPDFESFFVSIVEDQLGGDS